MFTGHVDQGEAACYILLLEMRDAFWSFEVFVEPYSKGTCLTSYIPGRELAFL